MTPTVRAVFSLFGSSSVTTVDTHYVEVAVDFPDDRARLFTYLVPTGMSLGLGDLVIVPFGAQAQPGIVFGGTDRAPETEARQVASKISDAPYLAPERIATARWIATYYRTTYFNAASVMLPPGALGQVRYWLTLAQPGADVRDFTPGEQRALDLVPEGTRTRKDRMVRRLGTGGRVIVDRLIRRGVLVAAAEIESPAHVKSEEVVIMSQPSIDAAALAAINAGTRGQRKRELLEWMTAGNSPARRKELVARFGAAALAAVVGAGAAAIDRRPVFEDPLAQYRVQQQFAPDLTPEQSGAAGAIVASIASGMAARFLLFGVTGSGKTEVYVRAVEACIAAGKQAIVLVPEISLTPQMLRTFASRFPGKVALQHSGLTDRQRFDQWYLIRQGKYPIVLGSRSAVFAPLQSLGLVVIDEEHEWTYKQADTAPRYNARDVAERLCAECSTTLVLGSATPDIVSFRRAERGELRLIRLPYRLAVASQPALLPARPRTELVDMREELRAGHIEVLSRSLLGAIGEALDGRGRVVLFINRRGMASFIQCRDCGAVRRCRRCDTSLVYHRAERKSGVGRLMCHYCGYQVSAGRACPTCRGKQVLRVGAGTQAVADAVHLHFPKAGVVRWDSDTARTAADHTRLLERFERGDSNVLVGTQMVAKGLDVPSVTLVGIVSADISLALPDFRAAERTFQLLVQASGRSGRGTSAGRVVIQTFQPEHYAVAASLNEDYEAFYREELQVRSKFAYPPFTRLIRLTYSDPEAATAEGTAREFAATLRRERETTGDTSVEVVGPTPCFPHRLRGRWRWQVVLRGPDPSSLLERLRPGRGWVTDVDPVSLA